MAALVGDDNGNVLVGGCAADNLHGNGGNDTLRGNGGNDGLFGSLGCDLLLGGIGSDRLFGGKSNDTLVGGFGRDFLTGGAGSDAFRFDDNDAGDAFAGPLFDVIRDFSSSDLLDLVAVDIVRYDGLGISEPGNGAFSIWQVGGSTYVRWNTTGGYHDVELTGFTGDLYDQILWYEDDYLANVNTTASIAAGQTRAGTIEVPEDEDWFAITLTQDVIYTFDGSATGDGDTLLGAHVILYDSAGDYLTDNFNELQFIADVTGVYYLGVTGFFGGAGTYHLAVQSVVDDYAGDTGTAGVIEAGQTRDSEIQFAGDEDWFRVTLTQGMTYLFDVSGGTPQNPAFTRLYGPEGGHISDGYGQLAFLADPSGTYYVAVGWSGQIGTYQLAMQTVVDDYAYGTGTAGEIAAGQTSSGEIQFATDEDWFRITLTQGAIYTFDVLGVANGGGTLLNPFARLQDAEGYLVTAGEPIGFLADQTGTYYVAVGSWDGTGTYQLAVQTAIDDYAGDTGTAGEIAAGETRDGEVHYDGDQDWFRVSLTQGETYTIELRGSGSGSGPLEDPFLILRNGSGDEIDSNGDFSGFDSQIVHTATSTGTYFIDARGTGYGDGTYELSVATDDPLSI